MNQPFVVRTSNQIAGMKSKVRSAASLTLQNLRALGSDPMEALWTLKFEPQGHHPLSGQRANIVEQLIGTFTVMATLAAADLLLKSFPNTGGLVLRPGNIPGREIESVNPNVVEAEVLALVNMDANNRLGRNINRMVKSSADNRFVFFYCPDHAAGRRRDLEEAGTGVRVWALGRDEIL